VISAFGLGVNEKAVLIDVLRWGEWDVFLLAGRYTLLEQAPLDDLLPMCITHSTSIVVGGPLNSGILAGRDTWNYAAAPPDIVARVNAIAPSAMHTRCRCRPQRCSSHSRIQRWQP
jgi:D-threo-aldose 1-dehydrogenase